ncbi:galanin receptor type 1-like [Exaiptasia diaphana]|uniref:G-protein coupled receptors family 1 profile domain-containing protein n=1 Tax=Exaiptasia diaphana TaxID=2652724 RepID=A0A913YK03_EXADI|nr:galanin receptor type 1-like [Exaiptasia diaphana]XP_020903522.1 galanin receptor type 1-like [Exaiptasia diaphana]XP_028515735.1 galanin receptor type 1-like [Exaiptasia diaphana]XP_028515736.1 galanin receptor type 1-like [Exaiptasia diaphana]
MENTTLYHNSSAFLRFCSMDSLGQRIAKLVALGILLVLSLAGNSLVCVIVYRHSSMRTTINYLLVNMSLSDFTTPILVLTKKIVEISTNSLEWNVGGILGSFLCKTVYYISDISPIVSVLSLLMISYDRFAAIVFPLKAARYPSKYRKYFIGLTWILACILCSPYFYFLNIKSVDGKQYCMMLWDNNTRRAYTVPLTVVFIIIPFLLLVAMYSCILYKVKTHPKNLSQTERGKRRSQVSKRNTTILSFTVVFTFAVCWGPYFAILMLSNFQWNWKHDYCSHENFIFTVQFLAYSNATINPLLYFLFLRNFRNGLHSLCKTSCAELEKGPKENRGRKRSSMTLLSKDKTSRNTYV